MAAPQVSALAALLWQQDLSKSNIFIRNLIDISANKMGNEEKYGYGLIDYDAALEDYSEAMDITEKDIIKNFDKNDKPLLCVEDDELQGFWTRNDHQNMAKDGGYKSMEMGARWPDEDASGLKKAGKHPEFHGYFKYEQDKTANINYINAAIYLTRASMIMYTSGTWISDNVGLTGKSIGVLPRDLKESAEKYFKDNHIIDRKAKAAFIFGMAIHTVGDSFAHSTCAPFIPPSEKVDANVKDLLDGWGVIGHQKEMDGKKGYADLTTYIPNRFKSAQNVCKAMIDTAWKSHSAMSKNVYNHIVNLKYFDFANDFSRRQFLRNVFTMRNFTKFINPDRKNSNLLDTCNLVDEYYIKTRVERWRKK